VETIRQEVEREVSALLRLVFQDRCKGGRLDLEAAGMAMRAAMHRAGAAALSQLLQGDPPGPDEREMPCPCGQKARYREMRSRRVLTAVGEVELLRPWYLCSQCHTGQSPADAALDIEKADLSPGVRRMLALIGSEMPFDHGRRQIELLAGLKVTAKAVERTAEAIGSDIAQGEQREIQRAMQLDLPIVAGQPVPVLYVEMDGTGVPVVKAETEGRSGKVSGQPAHTREVKIGSVFTRATWDKEGYAIRDPGSTTYVAAIETAGEFGKRIYLEAWNRGWARAEKKVVIGDGAEWIWNIADLHFPGAIQIVDLFHARQHLWDLARKLHPNQDSEQRRWMTVHQDLLDEGKIEDLVAALRSIDTSSPELRETIRTEADYFENHTERMRYPKFRAQHLFVGSGVIEAGCKAIIGCRCKQSGMFWTVRGANAILALRCCQSNGRFEDYWEARRAA
jgi:hypothetical protein